LEEVDLGDPYEGDPELKGRIRRIIRWFENDEDARKHLLLIEKGEDGRFGGDKFETADDVFEVVQEWRNHFRIDQFGIIGTRHIIEGQSDLVFDCLVFKLDQKCAELIREKLKDPLTWLVSEPDEVVVSEDNLVTLWWD